MAQEADLLSWLNTILKSTDEAEMIFSKSEIQQKLKKI